MSNLEHRVENMVDHALPPLDPSDVDGLCERLLTEHRGRVAQRAGRPRFRASRVAALVGTCLVAASGVAIASEPDIAERIAGRLWFSHDAAEDIRADVPRAAGLEPFEIEVLTRLFNGAPVRPDSDMGPILEEMRPFNEGRVLYDGQAGRLAALASDRGDVCYVLSRNGAALMSTCVGDLPESGVDLTVFRAGERYVLPAIIATDVTSVTFRTGSGRRIDVPLGENGFVWDVQASDTEGYPVEIVVARAGTTFTSPVSISS